MASVTASSRSLEIAKIIIIWIVQWLAIVGGTMFILSPLGADQLSRFYLTCFYFLAFAGYGAWYYRIDQVFPHHINLQKQLHPILGLITMTFIFCLSINYLFPVTESTRQAIIHQKF
ncbi:MAG: hypothetical protein ACXVAX_07305, partial [Pseudobdellovibrio sp.]